MDRLLVHMFGLRLEGQQQIPGIEVEDRIAKKVYAVLNLKTEAGKHN